jgi:uncharacterized membrane-anchored protein
MIDKQKWVWPLLVFVALVQSAALFKMVYDRDRLLKSGREITLPTRPVDPRDIFRGDYVTLGYDISSLRKSTLPAEANLEDLRAGAPAYVTLTPDAASGWKAIRVTADYPRDVAASDIVLQGRAKSIWRPENKSDVQLNIRYGIESYFVPEGAGKALETKVREHKIEAIVAVDASGSAALKGLVVDGERHVDPPLL